MSALGDAMKGIKQLLLLQEQVRLLEKTGDARDRAVKDMATSIVDLDKRVIRIETMIEMTTSRGGSPPRIEGN